MQHLTIVTTGGTIDKIYFDDELVAKSCLTHAGETRFTS
jgi:hypothetical protein